MISPTIIFSGNCEEAINLYEKAFAVTEKHIEFYRDAPPDSGLKIPPHMTDKVMHARIFLCGTEFNVSDSNEEITSGNMVKFNVFLENRDQVATAFTNLSKGGKTVVEPGPQFFSKFYASVIDPFGIHWQLILI